MNSYFITLLLSAILSSLISIYFFSDHKNDLIRFENDCQKEIINYSEQAFITDQEIKKIEDLLKGPKTQNITKSYCVYDQTIVAEKYFEKQYEIPSFLINYAKATTIFKNQLQTPIEIASNPEYLSSISNFPRFQTVGGLPIDARFYGLLPDNNSLIEKKCVTPRLAFLHRQLKNHLLFFSINVGRQYQGVLSINSIKGLRHLKHSLQFSSAINPNDSETIISWHGLDSQTDGQIYENRNYDNNSINPLRFNVCNKSISFLSNICTFDRAFDMELRNYFYDFNNDQLVTQILCKTSNDLEWKEIGSGSLIRIR